MLLNTLFFVWACFLKIQNTCKSSEASFTVCSCPWWGWKMSLFHACIRGFTWALQLTAIIYHGQAPNPLYITTLSKHTAVFAVLPTGVKGILNI